MNTQKLDSLVGKRVKIPGTVSDAELKRAGITKRDGYISRWWRQGVWISETKDYKGARALHVPCLSDIEGWIVNENSKAEGKV